MLGEAIDIIRLLWQGGFQSYRGEYLELEDARVYDIPDPPPEIIVGISGPASARLAAEKADGVIAMEPKAELPNPVNGRDAWGWPVGVAHHLFGDAVDEAASEQAWRVWLNGVFATEAVA